MAIVAQYAAGASDTPSTSSTSSPSTTTSSSSSNNASSGSSTTSQSSTNTESTGSAIEQIRDTASKTDSSASIESASDKVAATNAGATTESGTTKENTTPTATPSTTDESSTTSSDNSNNDESSASGANSGAGASEINLQTDKFAEAASDISGSSDSLAYARNKMNNLLNISGDLDLTDIQDLSNDLGLISGVEVAVQGISGNLNNIQATLGLVDPDFGAATTWFENPYFTDFESDLKPNGVDANNDLTGVTDEKNATSDTVNALGNPNALTPSNPSEPLDQVPSVPTGNADDLNQGNGSNELSNEDAIALAQKLQVPVEYVLSLHLPEGYKIGDRLIPEEINPDVIHYAGENGYPILIDGVKDLGDEYNADAPERGTYFVKSANNFSAVNGGSEYNIQDWPITFGETEGKDVYWTYYGPISQGTILNKPTAPIQCTDTDLFPCDDGFYRDKDGYIVVAGSPYVNQFSDGVHVDYEANGGLDYEDTFVLTPFGLGRYYDNTAIQLTGGIECDFYVNDGYESNDIAQTEYGKRLRESAVEGYESLNLYWNQGELVRDANKENVPVDSTEKSNLEDDSLENDDPVSQDKLNTEGTDNPALSFDFGENGVYTYQDIAANGIKYTVDVIGEVTPNTKVILLNHGGGGVDTAYGTGGDYSYYEDWLNDTENDKTNAVFIRFNRAANNTTDAYKLLEEVSDNLNLSRSNCSTAGFSAGGEPAIEQMADFVKNNPEIESPMIMLIDTYLHNGGNNVSSETLQTLGDSNALLFNIRETLIQADLNIYEEWADKYGITVLKVEDNKCKNTSAESSHHGVLNDYFELGVVDYQTGEGNFPSGSFVDGNGEEIEYYSDAEVYDSESGEWQAIDIVDKSIDETYEMLGLEKPVSDKTSSTKSDEDLSTNNFVLPGAVMGTLYNQHNYGDVTYYVRGDGTVATLDSDGCGFFSSLSLFDAKTGHKFTDEEISYLVENVAGGQNGLSNDQRMEELFNYFGEKYNTTYEKSDYDINKVVSELEAGNGVIVMVPNSGSNSGHFVALTGINENGNIVANDTSTLLDKTKVDVDGFTLEEIDKIITDGNAWYVDFSGFYENVGAVSDDDVKDTNTENATNDNSNIDNNGTQTTNPNANTVYDEVPHFYQNTYAYCGPSTVAMLASYYNDKYISPDQVTDEVGIKHYVNGTGNSSWTLFGDAANYYNMPLEEEIYYHTADDLEKVMEALKNGSKVIVNVNVNATGSNIFTTGGHYLVLDGVTEDGKIEVIDPNKYNYESNSEVLVDGYENGFDPEHFMYGKAQKFWVYSPKGDITGSMEETTPVETVPEETKPSSGEAKPSYEQDNSSNEESKPVEIPEETKPSSGETKPSYEQDNSSNEESKPVEIPEETKPSSGETKPSYEQDNSSNEESKPVEIPEETKPSSGETRPSYGENNSSSGGTRPSYGENNSSSGGTRPSYGENNSSSGETRPSYGENNSSSGETRPSYGENNSSSGEIRPSYGENNSSSGETRPSYGENNSSSGEIRPSYGENNSSSGETRPSYGGNNSSSGEIRPSYGENNGSINSINNDSYVNLNNNNNNSNNNASIDNGSDASKYIVPGVIGTGLALLSAKIGKFIKKSKKNNDV